MRGPKKQKQKHQNFPQIAENTKPLKRYTHSPTNLTDINQLPATTTTSTPSHETNNNTHIVISALRFSALW